MRSMVSREKNYDDPLAEVGKPRESFADAKKELGGKATDIKLRFAKWREDIGDYVEANASYRDILADDPDNVDARVGIARVQHKTGQKRDALKILQATVNQSPESAVAWMATGRYHSEEREWELAEKCFSRVLKIDSSDRMANYELGVVLARQDRLEEAHEHLAVAGGASAGYYNIGFLLQEQGRNNEAIDWLQRALQSQPDQATKENTERVLAALLTSGRDSDTMIASSTPAVIDREKTTYQKFTERPDSQGRFPARAVANTAPLTIRPSATIRPANPNRSAAPASAVAPVGYSQSSPPAGTVRTANLARTLPQTAQTYPVAPSGLQPWNGPAATMPDQPQTPLGNTTGQANVDSLPIWRGGQ